MFSVYSQLSNPDLFWLSEGDALSHLFHEEIFVFVSRLTENALQVRQRTPYPT